MRILIELQARNNHILHHKKYHKLQDLSMKN